MEEQGGRRTEDDPRPESGHGDRLEKRKKNYHSFGVDSEFSTSLRLTLKSSIVTSCELKRIGIASGRR